MQMLNFIIWVLYLFLEVKQNNLSCFCQVVFSGFLYRRYLKLDLKPQQRKHRREKGSKERKSKEREMMRKGKKLTRRAKENKKERQIERENTENER